MIAAIKKEGIIFCIAFICLFSAFGVNKALAKIFTIGIANAVSNHIVTVDGFKAGMAESGYIEGKDVKYVYDGVINIPCDILMQAKKIFR
jgi:hypothetical protein